MTIRPETVFLKASCRLGLCSLVWLATAASAQSLRDPTVAPAAAGLSEAGVTQHEDTLKLGSISVLTRQGVHYLMHGTRLYAAGQTIGQARIERISETEVWLREGGRLQKIQVFSGVQRHPATVSVDSKKPTTAPVLVRPAKKMP